MKLLIVYGTTHGMTEKIARHMAGCADVDCDVFDAAHLPQDFRADRYDAIIVGGSLNAGGYQHAVRRFVRHNLAVLNARPTAFFSVCLAIRSAHEAERSEARRIAAAFPDHLGWRPAMIEVIAGALMFTKYNFFIKWIMARIARKETGPVDTTKDTIYTDWNQVELFTKRFVAYASEHRGMSAAA